MARDPRGAERRRVEPVSARGESLVEVVVALLLLAVGALALAGGIGQAQKARRLAASSGLALAAAEAWLESWRAGPSKGDDSGEGVIAWGAWRGTLEWETGALPDCVESARVAVAPADMEVAGASLSSLRMVTGPVGCGP
jgi:Tfp pilus assembly protein PilV